MSEELMKLLQKGAISEVSQIEQYLISRLFLVPKKEGTYRPVIDLRELNRFIQKEHFKMEGIHLMKDLLQEGDWMVKLDLKDAYFAIPIHHEHQKYLAFRWQGNTYQFKCLPFGLSSAPRVFTKMMRPAIAWLRQLGCKTITYLDDNLLMAPTKEEARIQIKLMISLLEPLGFVINYQKSVLEPTQRIDFLGFTINS